MRTYKVVFFDGTDYTIKASGSLMAVLKACKNTGKKEADVQSVSLIK